MVSPTVATTNGSVLRGSNSLWYLYRRAIVVSSRPARSTHRKFDHSSKSHLPQHPDHRIFKIMHFLQITRLDTIMFEGCHATYLPLLAHWPKEL